MPKVKRKTAQQALWYKGNLSWKFHEGQRTIDEAYSKVKNKLFVGNCARRFGKTVWLVAKAIECALKCTNRNPRIKYASATVKNLEEYVLPAFELVLHDCPEELWAGWTTGWVRTKKKFVFQNGAEINLVGLDKDPDGGRGNYCDLYIFDEAGYIDSLEYLYGSVVAPMTLTRPNSKIIMMSTPSSTPAHPFLKFCNRAKASHAYVELNIFANPMMTPELIESAKEECLSESDWLREYMVQHVIDKNLAIVPEWEPLKMIKDIERPEHFHLMDLYEGMDLGTKRDLTAVLFAYWNPLTKQLVVEDECDINGPQMTTPVLRDMIFHKERELWPGREVYRRVADNNNPLLLQDLGSLHGLFFSPTTKDEIHAMVNELRRMIRENMIVVSTKCKFLIASLSGGIWDKHRKVWSRTAELGHFDHLAALMYLVRNLDTRRDITDQLVKYNPALEHRREAKRERQVVKTIKKMFGFNRRD
jgi:hypothetical protein